MASSSTLEQLKSQFGDYQDNTAYLRIERNSGKIRDDILRMERLKRSYNGDRHGEEFRELCRQECRFLFDEYTFIFNKMLKDVIDLKIMFTLLKIMQDIETEKINQEEGSVLVGKILKELYLDCAVREGEQISQQYDDEKVPPMEGKAINWKTWKSRTLTPS